MGEFPTAKSCWRWGRRQDDGEELDIPAKVLNKAIAAAIKANLDDVKDDLDQVELVLVAAGRA